MSADELYEEGQALSHKGDLRGAMECFLRAAELAPDGRGAAALELMRSIYAFRHTDSYNP